MNLTDFIKTIKSFPMGVHNLLTGATDKNILILTERIGNLSDFLKQMLKEFDGAELFINGIPFLTIFRSINNPSLPTMEWNPEWCVDIFTRKWRETHNGSNELAFAMTNYGGLILLDEKEKIKEWDMSERRWIFQNMLIADWFEKIISEGKETLEAQ